MSILRPWNPSQELYYGFLQNMVMCEVSKTIHGWHCWNGNLGLIIWYVHLRTILQSGRSRVRFPKRIFFLNWSYLSSPNVALTLSLTEMSTRNLPGGDGGLRVRLTTSPPSVSRSSRQFGRLNVRNRMGLHSMLQGYLFMRPSEP
jgi:hypothetical protein